MSMHKKPLTPLEEEGLRLHGLDVGTPSQLSDVFRHGIAWALSQTQSGPEPVQGEAVEVVATVSTMGFGKHFAMGIGESINKLTPGDELMAVAQHQRIIAAQQLAAGIPAEKLED